MLNLYLGIRNWLQREEGQDVIEYALLAGLISVAAVTAIIAAGGSVSALFDAVSEYLEGITVPG